VYLKKGKAFLDFIVKYFKKLPEESIIIVTSKIVALSERRTAIIEIKKLRIIN